MSDLERVETDAAPAAAGPYSQAIRGAGWIFAAGQVGVDPGTRQLVEGVAAQAERAIANMAAILAAAGSGLDRVVKTTVFLTEIEDFATVNEVYARHFSEPYPARSTVAVAALPLGAAVEIECLALGGESS